jgi:hypothetical protein
MKLLRHKIARILVMPIFSTTRLSLLHDCPLIVLYMTIHQRIQRKPKQKKHRNPTEIRETKSHNNYYTPPSPSLSSLSSFTQPSTTSSTTSSIPSRTSSRILSSRPSSQSSSNFSQEKNFLQSISRNRFSLLSPVKFLVTSNTHSCRPYESGRDHSICCEV